MKATEVVVRKAQGPGGVARTGVVLARNAGVLRVRWDDDGTEEDARIGGSTTFAPAGSLRHQSLVDPGPLAERLETEPLEVVLQLLREARTPMRTPVIKDQLKVLGLSQEAVDRAWRKVQSRLTGIEEVRIRTSGYRWIGPVEPRPAVPETVEVAATGPRGPVDEAEAIAEALRSADGPEAKAWSEALSWYASLLSGDEEANRAKEQFTRRFSLDPWNL
ncbi:hypothetical protein [Actinocorallia longicatena]|uniref:Uncharacterized protein n=1 Tax=Actinocorallia longicatena TaxID=111803 RepID=A0ABP6QSL4_9ACTN